MSKTPRVRTQPVPGRCIQIRYKPEGEEEVRFSTGSHDQRVADAICAEVQAKLTLGIDPRPAPKRKKKDARGLKMNWQDFRIEYRRLKSHKSRESADRAETVLDVVQRILNPKTVLDVVDQCAELVSRMRAGEGQLTKRKRGPRSDGTIESYIATLQAAINWMADIGWMKNGDRVRLARPTGATSKGRPLTDDEFKRMLSACKMFRHGPEHWRYLLRGIWESGLRLEEAFTITWDVAGTIQPKRLSKSGLVVLDIPASEQKNGKSQIVPTSPHFAKLLEETPPDQRTGFVFNPVRQNDGKRNTRHGVIGGKITDIGKEAGVTVSTKGKPASAQDLRRSFGQRMADAGVSVFDLQSMMRHSSIETTQKYYLHSNAAEQAERIAEKMDISWIEEIKEETNDLQEV